MMEDRFTGHGPCRVLFSNGVPLVEPSLIPVSQPPATPTSTLDRRAGAFAGISSGGWMAQQKHRKHEYAERPCANCGQPYQPTNGPGERCPTCSEAHSRQLRLNAQAEKRQGWVKADRKNCPHKFHSNGNRLRCDRCGKTRAKD
jgi:DNA-directed RNA polymerase subunit RPC12/RpoP